MIHIKRNKKIPAAFASKEITRDKRIYEEFYKLPFEKRAQLRVRSKNTVGDTAATIEAVASQFKFKCAFCEKELKDRVVVDSFRPRINARGLQKDFFPDHYWWLAYDWRNKYAVCKDCNEYKATWFPVEGARAEIKASYQAIIDTEKNLLLDPCNDYPEEHLFYNGDGKIISLTKKGEVTIEILKLNRTDLVHKRKNVIAHIEQVISETEVIVKKLIKTKLPAIANKFADKLKILENYLQPHPGDEFIGVRRQCIIKFLHNTPGIMEHTEFWRKHFISQDSPVYRQILESIKFFIDICDEKKEGEFTFKASFIIHEIEKIKKSRPVKTGKRKTKAGKPELSRSDKGAKKEGDRIIQSLETTQKYSNKQLSASIQSHWNYPEKIEICNFKSISNLEIKFINPENKEQAPNNVSTDPNTRVVDEGKPWKLLLGENGVGKSSILQAIALTLAGNSYIRELDPDPKEILSHGTKKGFVRIHMVGSDEPIELTYQGGKKPFIRSSLNVSKINLLGYGSTRLLPKGKALRPEKVSGSIKVKNLFDYSVALTDVNEWLLKIDKKTFNRVGMALKDLLNRQDDDNYFIRNKGKIYFSRRKETLYELSEGYRSVIALAVDIMRSLNSENTSYDVAEGIVLIDEISSHLHPSWQMRIVKAFRKSFPKLYFIVCSHDPLSLKGLRENEVLLLRRDEDDNVRGIENLPNPSEHTAEQLLTSEFFGLNSTMDPELEIRFNTYHGLLSKEKRSKTEEEHLNKLRDILKPKIHLGNTLREELFYSIIDTDMQENKKSNYTTGRKDLVKNIKQKASDLFDKLSKQ